MQQGPDLPALIAVAAEVVSVSRSVPLWRKILYLCEQKWKKKNGKELR